MGFTEPDLTPYLEHLRGLPFVTEAELIQAETTPRVGARFDAFLRLHTFGRAHKLLVEVKRTHLTRTLADGVIGQAAQFQDQPWILFARHIGRPMGQFNRFDV